MVSRRKTRSIRQQCRFGPECSSKQAGSGAAVLTNGLHLVHCVLIHKAVKLRVQAAMGHRELFSKELGLL